jgi:hypothetical protein
MESFSLDLKTTVRRPRFPVNFNLGLALLGRPTAWTSSAA